MLTAAAFVTMIVPLIVFFALQRYFVPRNFGRGGEGVVAKTASSDGPRRRSVCTYGVVGNGETAALIGPDLAIRWLCLPRFDGTPFFASALDPRRGGD